LAVSTDYLFYMYQYHNYHYSDVRKGCKLHYLALLRKGNAKIVTETETLEIRQGEVFYIPRGINYESYWYGDPEIEFLSFGFLTIPIREQKSYRLQTLPHSEVLIDMLQKIPLQGNQVGSRALSLFYGALSEAASLMLQNPMGMVHNIADQAMRYIRKHPHAQVQEIARGCGVSQPHLYASFRSATGTSPNKYRQKILCNMAVELLITTDRTVEDISNQLCFSSPSYFRKVLYKHTKMTPKQLRSQRELNEKTELYGEITG